MSFIVKDTIHLMISEPYYNAKYEVNWNETKYGTDEIGVSIDSKFITHSNVNQYVLTITKNNAKLKTTKTKIKQYLLDNSNALTKKFNKEIVILPLSIFEKVDNEEKFDIDINNYNSV